MKQYDEIIARGSESKDLDYKAAMEWNEKDKEAACELVKDIIAMANTLGGWIIIGVAENDTGFDWVGLSDDQMKSFESTRLLNFVQKYAEPPINCEVVKHEYEGKNYVIIVVPPFDITPHIVKSNYESVLSRFFIYVRTDNNESAPLATFKGFTSLIERAVSLRQEQLLTNFRTILQSGKFTEIQDDSAQIFNIQLKDIQARAKERNPLLDLNLGYMETYFHPTSNDAERFTFDELREMLKESSVPWTGWPLIFTGRIYEATNVQDGTEFGFSPNPLSGRNQSFHYWHAKQNGLVYVTETLREDTFSEWEPGHLIAYEIICQETAKMVDSLVRYYRDRISPEEKITLTMKINKTEGRKLFAFDSYDILIHTAKKCAIDTIERSKTLSYADWEAGIIDHALYFTEYVFQMFSWSDPDLWSAKSIMEKMFKRQLY